MPSTEKDRSVAIACMIAAVFSFGSVPVFLRYLAGHLDVWTVNGVRYSVAALFWLPVVLCSRRELPSQPRRNIWRDALAPAAVNLVAQVLWGVIHYHSSATTIAFAIKFSFLFTILFGFVLIPAERPLARTRLFQAGAAVATAGLAVMFWERLHTLGAASLGGLLLILVSTVFWGGYAVAVRRTMSGWPVPLSFGVISLYTAGGLAALMSANVVRLWATGQVWALPGTGAWVWGVMVVSALIGIAFSHVLHYRGIHTLGRMVSTGMLLGSAFVTALAAPWFPPHEGITAKQLAGGLLIVLGGALLVTAQARLPGRTAGP